LSLEELQEGADGPAVHVLEVTLGHSAWYWAHSGGAGTLRFAMQRGRLLLGEPREPVGVNLSHMAAALWVSRASPEELASIRTAKGAKPGTMDLLSRMPGLEAVECSDLSGKQIEFMCRMGLPLKFLSLSWCDDLYNVAPLARLQGLVRLMLSDLARLSNIRPVGEIVGLERLDIINCDSVHDLTPLHGLERLKDLYIGGCRGITLEQIADFRKACPQCTVRDV